MEKELRWGRKEKDFAFGIEEEKICLLGFLERGEGKREKVMD